jgi:hypothetical protein
VSGHGIHDHSEIAHIEHVANPTQLFTIRLDDEKRLLHSVVGSCLAVRGDRDHPSARFEYAQDRCKVSPPTVSNTTSIIGIGSSKRSA